MTRSSGAEGSTSDVLSRGAFFLTSRAIQRSVARVLITLIHMDFFLFFFNCLPSSCVSYLLLSLLGKGIEKVAENGVLEQRGGNARKIVLVNTQMDMIEIPCFPLFI